MTDTQSLIEALILHAFDDCGERHTPTHVANIAAAELQSLSAERDALLVDNERLRYALRHIAYNYDVSSLQMDPANNPLFIALAALEAALSGKE